MREVDGWDKRDQVKAAFSGGRKKELDPRARRRAGTPHCGPMVRRFVGKRLFSAQVAGTPSVRSMESRPGNIGVSPGEAGAHLRFP
jgi:hypothetical protein